MCSKFGSLVLAVAVTGGAMLSFCGSASALIISTPTYSYDLYISDSSGDFINLDLTTSRLAGPLPLPSDGAPIIDITGSARIDGTDYSASGPDIFNGADNLLYSTFPFVDSSGIAFDLTPLVFIDPPYSYSLVGLSCVGPCPDFIPNNVQLTQTPLPAALPLFATGLGAMGLFGWRRKRKNAAAIAAA